MSEAPRWIRDLRRFLPLRSQFLLSGNVRDRYPVALDGAPPLLLPLVEYLGVELVRSGIHRILAFDPVSGFHVPPTLERDSSDDENFFSGLGLKFDDKGRAVVSHERFFETLASLVEAPPEPGCRGYSATPKSARHARPHQANLPTGIRSRYALRYVR